MNRVIIISARTITISVSSSRAISACSCFNTSVDSAYSHASVVFLGRVIKAELRNDEVDAPPALRRFGDYVVATLEVQKIWKGVVDTLVQIRTGRGDGDCGVVFILSRNFLVYAYDTPKGLATNICSRSGDDYFRKTDIEELNMKYSVSRK